MAGPSPQPPVVLWFRDDLRLADNPALGAAIEARAPLICLYVFEDGGERRPLGGASHWWLAGSLRALEADLDRRGQRLVLRRGTASAVVPALVKETGAVAVHCARRYGMAERAVDAVIANSLRARGVELRVHTGTLLFEPEALHTDAGRPARVYAAFNRRLQAVGPPRRPKPASRTLPPPDENLRSESLDAWHLEPTAPDWASGLRHAWQPGEAGAQKNLAAFVKTRLQHYATARDRVDNLGSSRLSPHLRFGELSPSQIWHAVNTAKSHSGADKFLSELAWRDFAYHQLTEFPEMATRNLRESFDAFPWRDDAGALRAWQRGRTGYPIVDAAMRELWITGWMPNRLRMVTASFLVKHLLIDWRRGEEWFWDTLVDADPANNAINWQWVAGSGIDSTPYFRIFNPILQGRRVDPEGDYVRRWLPELAGVPTKHIHAPWELSAIELAGFGVTLGKTYPEPTVDHAHARQRALAALRNIRT